MSVGAGGLAHLVGASSWALGAPGRSEGRMAKLGRRRHGTGGTGRTGGTLLIGEKLALSGEQALWDLEGPWGHGFVGWLVGWEVPMLRPPYSQSADAGSRAAALGAVCPT